ncbi:MAG: helix-turn-helix transcriptional regulator [Pseudomonadota bacterium]
MHPETDIVSAIRFAGAVVGLVCFVTFYVQRRLHPLFGVSAVMFFAFTISYAYFLAGAFIPDLSVAALHATHMLAIWAATITVPAFFLQYKLLRNLDHKITRRDVVAHGLLPAIAFLVLFAAIWLPPSAIVSIAQRPSLGGEAFWVALSGKSVFALALAIYVQWFTYVGLIVWTHWTGRHDLKRRFGRDARVETAWIAATITVFFIFAGFTALSFFSDLLLDTPLMTPIQQAVLVFAFMLLAALNSLRQTPGPFGWTRAREGGGPRETGTQKYSKSALAKEHAERIERKLTAAMQDDSLFRDPSLSLTKLAKHIGSSPNYVSQTLNEHMNQSFFDFINHWRIKEAEDLLTRDGDDTILSITYDVGFNSRSAFYTAFKKHVGVTPSQYRAQKGAGSVQGAGRIRPSARLA